MNEWKIEGWKMKTLFVLASVAGIIVAVGFTVGFIEGFLGVI